MGLNTSLQSVVRGAQGGGEGRVQGGLAFKGDICTISHRVNFS